MAVQTCAAISLIAKKSYLAECLVQKVTTLNTVPSLKLVRYFLSNFYFFHQMTGLQKL